MSRCQRECQEFESLILLHIMYKIYFTDPETGLPHSTDTGFLSEAISLCEFYRGTGFLYVTMVSDYADMVGKPGAQGAGAEYVPQMLG